jgi:hypothetical protein
MASMNGKIAPYLAVHCNLAPPKAIQRDRACHVSINSTAILAPTDKAQQAANPRSYPQLHCNLALADESKSLSDTIPLDDASYPARNGTNRWLLPPKLAA